MAAICVDTDSTDIWLHFAYVKAKTIYLHVLFVHKIYEQFIPDSYINMRLFICPHEFNFHLLKTLVFH